MPITPLAESAIVTGDPFPFQVDATIDTGSGETAVLPPSTIKVAIVSKDRSELLIEPITLIWDTTALVWVGEFSGTQTKTLLNDPDNLASGVKYPQVLIEVEFSTLRVPARFWNADVVAGLIPTAL